MICQQLDATLPAELSCRALPTPDLTRALLDEMASVLNFILQTVTHRMAR